MMTLSVVVGLIALLGLGFFYAVRVGKKMQRLNNFEEGQDKVKRVNEGNRKIDEETDKKINSTNNPVGSPWLRK